VLAPAVARRLRQAMQAVARSGTGVGLAPPGFAVAMKTGTAAERGQGYHVNYIGFGPLPGAELAFCVRVTHEPTSPAVTTVARSVTRALLGALADRWQASRRGTFAVHSP
jgi:cell division protein FtsI/penicillin-binding protein 2